MLTHGCHRGHTDAAKDVVAGHIRWLRQHQACNAGVSWSELDDDLELRVTSTSADWAALRLMQASAVLDASYPCLLFVSSMESKQLSIAACNNTMSAIPSPFVAHINCTSLSAGDAVLWPVVARGRLQI